MKKVLSEYYGVNNNNEKTAKVFIETLGDEKKFYAECYVNGEGCLKRIETATSQAAEDFAKGFTLLNRSFLSE